MPLLALCLYILSSQLFTRLEWTSPTDLIHLLSSLLPVMDRQIHIGKRYLPKAIINNANVCLLHEEYLDTVSRIISLGFRLTTANET